MSNQFVKNAAAFTEAFGVRRAPLIVWLSMIDWDDDDRDAMITHLTGKGASSASTAVNRPE